VAKALAKTKVVAHGRDERRVPGEVDEVAFNGENVAVPLGGGSREVGGE
jgi:hypothetical protein